MKTKGIEKKKKAILHMLSKAMYKEEYILMKTKKYQLKEKTLMKIHK